MKPFKNYVFVLIIVGCGLLAGTYNAHIQLEQIVETGDTAPHIWRISILRSIIAAFTVPLFLTIIKSKIIDISEGLTLEKGLVLIGFCLIAAVNADKFLDTVFNNAVTSYEKLARENRALNSNVLKVSEENKKMYKTFIQKQKEFDARQNMLLANQNLQKEVKGINHAQTNNKDFLRKYAKHDLSKNQWNIIKLLSANTNNMLLDSIKNEVGTSNFEKEIQQLEQKKVITLTALNKSNNVVVILNDHSAN